MSSQGNTYLKFGAVTAVIVVLLGYLAYTGVQDSKSYYVTIKELHAMGSGAYAKRLRVAGNVKPGSIKRNGTHVQFVLVEQDQTLRWITRERKLRPTRSKTNRKPWPTAKLVLTAFSRPRRCKPSVHRSTLPSNLAHPRTGCPRANRPRA
jgi:hypothetical protein